MVLANSLGKFENEAGHYKTVDGSHHVPTIPLYKARQIMTRVDFIQSYDYIDLFTITCNVFGRADSVPMQRVFRTICFEAGFQEHLEATLDRIAAIESLGRPREIVSKDLVQGWKYKFLLNDGEKRGEKVTEASLDEEVEEREPFQGTQREKTESEDYF